MIFTPDVGNNPINPQIQKKAGAKRHGKKPAEIWQYLVSNPAPFQCKEISAGLVIIDGL